MDAKDRKALLLAADAKYNGIDFVEIANRNQTALRVHFFNTVPLKGTFSATPAITGGETIPTVAVDAIDDSTAWNIDDDHLVLTLTVPAPGDFSNYTLAMSSPVLDVFYSQAIFSFKARCPSDLDCQTPPVQCPTETADVPPIDYLSKDFLGFRQALLDFSALRYPEWQERSEADFGVMFLEALSSLADDLSYQQDRVAAEAGIETATQRRSIVSLARLVDYEPAPALAATVLLQFDVAPGVTSLPDGLLVCAPGPDGASIPFETGGSLVNRYLDASGARLSQPPASTVSAAWNRGVIQPYWFDDSQRCLPAGATQMFVLGIGYNFQPGQALLIETAGATSADPPIRQIVHLASDQPATELCDPLFLQPYDPDAPVSVPGLNQIAYRVGDYTTFRHALLRALPGETALTRTVNQTVVQIWRPGAEGDLALQMMEWWAYLADILTFYNERVANQAYMRTADLPEIVNRLIRLLGYRPRPGIGATGTLAALMNSPASFALPRGFQIQSKPGPGQSPQIF